MKDQDAITKVLLELVDDGELDMGVDPDTGQFVFWHKEPALVENPVSAIS